MVVTYKDQQKTEENFQSRLVHKIHLMAEEKVCYELIHSSGTMVARQVSAHPSS